MPYLILLLIAFVISSCQAPSSEEKAHSSEANTNAFLTRFEHEVRAFEQSDSLQAPQPGGLLFVGSSSFRLWKNFSQDLEGLPVIQRGVGGSTLAEINYYFDRLVLPYQPGAIFLYEGDNDLVADSISPEKFQEEVIIFHQKIRQQLPGTELYLLAVKPSPSRRHLLDKARQANALMEQYAAQDSEVTYVDIFSPMMDSLGRIRPEIFLEDSLHMNEKGYAIWTKVIRPMAKNEGLREWRNEGMEE